MSEHGAQTGQARWTSGIAIATATLGVVSGYSLYILWWQQDEQGEPAWKFALAFAAAALMSFAFEVLRGAVEGSTHRWSRSRVVSTIVMLAAFELFVIASHTAVDQIGENYSGVAGFIFGEQFASSVSTEWNLLALGLLWLVVALTIVFKLRQFIHGWPYADSQTPPKDSTVGAYVRAIGPDLLRGAGAGIKAGAVWGALSAIAYVLFFRLYFLARWIHGDYQSWQNWLGDPTLHVSGWLYLFLYGPAIVAGWGAKYLGGLGLIAGVALVTVIARALVPEQNRALATIWPAATILLLLAVPIFAEPQMRFDLLYLAYLAAVIWGVPATLLGLLAPLLRRPAYHTPIWGFVACAAAGVMALVTAARLYSGNATRSEKELLLTVTAALMVLAFALFRGVWSEEIWLCVALSIGAIVWGATSLVQQVNLFTMQRNAHDLFSLPLGIPDSTTSIQEQLNLLPYLREARFPADQLTDGGLAGLMPAGVMYVSLLADPCGTIRGLSSDQRAEFAKNLTDAAANDRSRTAEIGQRAQNASQLWDQVEGYHAGLLQRERDALKRIAENNSVQAAGGKRETASAQIGAIRKLIDEVDDDELNLHNWQDWTKKNAGSAFIGHGVPDTSCNTEMDPLLADLKRADDEREAAASGMADTSKRIAAEIPLYSADLVAAEKQLDASRDTLQLAQSQRLELTMTSSLGFWVTIGLLAIWRLTEASSEDHESETET